MTRKENKACDIAAYGVNKYIQSRLRSGFGIDKWAAGKCRKDRRRPLVTSLDRSYTEIRRRQVFSERARRRRVSSAVNDSPLSVRRFSDVDLYWPILIPPAVSL
ncbi:hypothetical protein EVAR_75511_1 [Eumeta japonica]|uniref:Uncharacterized protein n=1 Tax=Eumeta variegata TaxID=151549 RepID=A0A4C1UJ77_EUMVA|nr:hypothetical protein EVAR_75511_1 [Eumeta japonica]